jgi:hypothetical protein
MEVRKDGKYKKMYSQPNKYSTYIYAEGANLN